MAQKKITLTQLDQTVQDAINAGGSSSNASQLNGQPPSYYLDRTNHTGTQAIASVTGLQSALDGKTTTTYVDSKVAALVASSPSTLDTLKELADAIGDDPNFATTVATSIGTKLAKSANLSDLASASTARSNLGLATVAATGAYGDLSGRPDLSVYALTSALTAKANELPDATVSAAGALAANTTSNVTAAGTYTAPTPDATVATPPKRFAIFNAYSASVTLSFPRYSDGNTVSLTILPGEAVIFRQKSTSGYANEAGNKPLSQLDLRYVQPSQLATVATSGSYADLSNKPTIPPATTLTTTGSGAATYNGTTGALNIPTPATPAVTSLTTTGTSGPATLSSGVLNIPQYSGGGSSGITRSINQITVALTGGTTALTDYVYWWTGTTVYLFTLPSAASNSNMYTVINTGTVNQAVAPGTSQTINGSSGNATVRPGDSLSFMPINGNWTII